MSRPLPLDLLNLKVSTIPEAMISPPTITRGVDNANSTVVSTATTSTATILPSSPRLTWAHGTATPVSFPAMYWTPNTINYGGGTRTANYISVRFMTDAPEFDFTLGNRGGKAMLWVDGQPMSRTTPYVVPSNTAYAYHKVSFGADALTYMVESATVTAGGTGYAVGDIVTLSGGTFTAAAQIFVSAVSSGVVTGVIPLVAGNYSAVPASPVGQDTTTGSGTGLTITPVWGQRHTSRKWRRLEIMLTGSAYFGGINVPSGCTVLRGRSPARSGWQWATASWRAHTTSRLPAPGTRSCSSRWACLTTRCPTASAP